MGIDAGTLGGFDLALAISQEAVNVQLEKLYDTEVEAPVPGGPKYLIDHEFHLHSVVVTKKQERKVSRKGLDAFVYCPKIDFQGDTQSSSGIARVTYKFRRALPGEVSAKDLAAGVLEDSVIRYQIADDIDENGNTIYINAEKIINEWEMSWEAVVTKKEMKDVMNSIIQASESSESPVAVGGKTKEKLQDYVDSSVFRVSTIFCAFSSAQIASTFRLVNPNASPEDAHTGLNMVEEIINLLNRQFGSEQKVTVDGVSTPHNPFVLGYTISQKNPSPAQYNPAAASGTGQTFRYFTPSDFRCTLSKADPSSMTKGTLNFCLLTQRDQKPPTFVEPDAGRQFNDNVDTPGRFDPNLFGTMKIKATPGSADGILAISQDIFMNHWIGSYIAPRFYNEPSTIFKRIESGVYDHFDAYQFSPYGFAPHDWVVNKTNRNISRDTTYKWDTEIKTRMIVTSVDALCGDPLELMRVELKTSVEVSYKNRDTNATENEKRRIDFQVVSRVWLKLCGYRKRASWMWLRKPNIDDDNDWEEIHVTQSWTNLQYRFSLGTDNINRGSFTVFDQCADHLDGDGKIKAHDRAPDQDGQPGTWRTQSTGGWVAFWDFTGLWNDELRDMLSMPEKVVQDLAATSANAMTDLVKGLQTSIILPAGDVFMFKGLGTFDEGHVATVVNYDLSTESEIALREGKTLSFESWKLPTTNKT
ncbi:hypothetical protein PDE_09699 [Penicillium oxalicum 114-2]|uniref:Uncharacterized protein n=1 Tax=Penicillium oxalicum (strain 114-2 / CGMCC 5302) TaxID=933388 RepID=S7ZVG8_PENO1|nr:hypothetical protein PDE_09699 [Penicillium oxalicum 114-2]